METRPVAEEGCLDGSRDLEGLDRFCKGRQTWSRQILIMYICSNSAAYGGSCGLRQELVRSQLCVVVCSVRSEILLVWCLTEDIPHRVVFLLEKNFPFFGAHSVATIDRVNGTLL